MIKPWYKTIMEGPKGYPNCSNHKLVCDASVDSFTSLQGYFHREKLLRRIRFADGTTLRFATIYWDYVIRWLEENQKALTIPLRNSFFHKTKGHPSFRSTMPELLRKANESGDYTFGIEQARLHAIAWGGNDSKTVGHAVACPENLLLFEAWRRRSGKLSDGMVKANEKRLRDAIEHNAIPMRVIE